MSATSTSITADGFENLSRHTPLETFRVKVE